jgi:hypothetical protein
MITFLFYHNGSTQLTKQWWFVFCRKFKLIFRLNQDAVCNSLKEIEPHFYTKLPRWRKTRMHIHHQLIFLLSTKIGKQFVHNTDLCKKSWKIFTVVFKSLLSNFTLSCVIFVNSLWYYNYTLYKNPGFWLDDVYIFMASIPRLMPSEKRRKRRRRLKDSRHNSLDTETIMDFFSGGGGSVDFSNKYDDLNICENKYT